MKPAPLWLLCTLVAQAARPSTGACGDTPGLRLNHAQVLATHNSYHLAGDTFIAEHNYSHPPLDVQLERGVRGFELDLFYDNSTRVFRVMHEPGADELSTCADLAACLGVVRAWSDAHPLHFPLFFQLEVLGGLAYLQGACLAEHVDSVRLCAIAKCEGQAPAFITLCIAFQCSGEATQALEQFPACASLTTCISDFVATLTMPSVDAATITESITRCTALSLLTGVPLGDVEAEAAAQLESVLDSHFPPARRIRPVDVLGDKSAPMLLVSYAHAGGANFWPEVDCSRGRALFTANYLGGVTSDAFFHFTHTGLVRKRDNPSSAQGSVDGGALARTRVDEGLAADPARQQVALASGAHVLSTDVPPPVGPAAWEAFAANDPLASDYFILPGGLPVRCNPVTTAGGTSCSSAQLEPADLTAPAESATATATTAAPPGGTTTETLPASETPTASATNTPPSTTTEAPATFSTTDTDPSAVAPTTTGADVTFSTTTEATSSSTGTDPSTATVTATADVTTTTAADVTSSAQITTLEASTAGPRLRPLRLMAAVAGLFAAL